MSTPPSTSPSSSTSGAREVNRITHPILHSSYPTEGREWPSPPTEEHFSIVKEEHSAEIEKMSRERSRECVLLRLSKIPLSFAHVLCVCIRFISASYEGSPNETFKRRPRGPGHTPNLGSRSLASADDPSASFGSSSSTSVLGLAGGQPRPSPLLPAVVASGSIYFLCAHAAPRRQSTAHTRHNVENVCALYRKNFRHVLVQYQPYALVPVAARHCHAHGIATASGLWFEGAAPAAEEPSPRSFAASASATTAPIITSST